MPNTTNCVKRVFDWLLHPFRYFHSHHLHNSAHVFGWLLYPFKYFILITSTSLFLFLTDFCIYSNISFWSSPNISFWSSTNRSVRKILQRILSQVSKLRCPVHDVTTHMVDCASQGLFSRRRPTYPWGDLELVSRRSLLPLCHSKTLGAISRGIWCNQGNAKSLATFYNMLTFSCIFFFVNKILNKSNCREQSYRQIWQ